MMNDKRQNRSLLSSTGHPRLVCVLPTLNTMTLYRALYKMVEGVFFDTVI